LTPEFLPAVEVAVPVVAPRVAVSPSDVPLEPLQIRRWPKLAGNLFFVWGLFAASVHSAVMVSLCFLFRVIDFSGTIIWTITLVWAKGILWLVGVKVESYREEDLPDGPLVFVCNHQSIIDILALFAAFPRRFVFVAKKSVFKYPFIGWHIWAAGYISVDRSNRESAIKSLEEAGQRIRNGVSVALFAEGTRSHDGSILPFKKGPFMLALKAGVPIVPVAIEGALQVTPKRQLYVCPNTVRVLMGPAVPTTGLTEADRDQLMREVRSTVIRLHRRLGGLGGDESNAIAAAGVEGIGRGTNERMSA
jgi:1-acyl-sn-glycerol-3-phosphate acyltransferase